MKNESNSLYISASYYDRINFDTYPWWTSISVCILMLCTRICQRCAAHVWCPHEWNKKGTRRGAAPGKSYNRNRCAPMCCFVHFRMRTYVLECESVLRRVDTFASCGLQFGWKGKTGKSLHRSRYRRPVCVIKVSLSESVSRLNKVFRWTEFRVTLEENDMQASRWAQNRDCILSERLSILNLANGQSVTLENRRIFYFKKWRMKNIIVYWLYSPPFHWYSSLSLSLILFFQSFLLNVAIDISKYIII